MLVRPLDLGRDRIIPALQCAATWQRQQVFIHCGNSANAQSVCGLNQTHFFVFSLEYTILIYFTVGACIAVLK